MEQSFAGTWKNVSQQTGGITKIEISTNGSLLYVHPWGACHPSDCDWGTRQVDASGIDNGSINLVWTRNYASTSMKLSPLSNESLRCVTSTHFTDGSGRKDYTSIDFFKKLGSTDYTVIMDEFNGSMTGQARGVTYSSAVATGDMGGGVFSYQNDSRVEYSFNNRFPRQGTLEFLIKVYFGYHYDNYAFSQSDSVAQIFGTDIPGGDVCWPGGMKIRLTRSGVIYWYTEIKYGQGVTHDAVAKVTPFRFGEWHTIGLSYGSEGQYVMVDGVMVYSDPSFTMAMSSAGNFNSPVDLPTIGQNVSAFWAHHRYDGGFNGIVRYFRASSAQRDWVISAAPSESLPAPQAGIPGSTTQYPEWLVYNTANSRIQNDYINAVAIDNQGNKWIGTKGGLVKYDGVGWTIFTPFLPNSDVRAICQDKSGNMWVGTWGGGLAKFNGSTWTLYNTSNSRLPGDYVWTIVADMRNRLWVGTSTGLAEFNGSDWTVFNQANSGLPDSYVRSVAVDRNGDIWVGTFKKELAKFDGARWTLYNTGNSGLIDDNDVRAIAIDLHGTKWIGTYGGLSAFDGRNWSSYNVSNSSLRDNYVLGIVVDEDNNKWVGTRTAGLARFDGRSWTIYNTSNSVLPVNDIEPKVFDASGNEWIKTWGGGLVVYRKDGVVMSKSGPMTAARSSLPLSLSTGLSFWEPSGNNLLDADEQGKIIVHVNNSGRGDAYGLSVSVEPHAYSGLSYSPTLEIGDVAAGSSRTVEIPITALQNVSSGDVAFILKFSEANGFEPSSTKIVFTTKALVPPKLVVSDVGVEDADGRSIIQPGKVVSITARIQNIGPGEAKNTIASIRIGENVFITEDSKTTFQIGNLASGQYKDIKFSLYTNNRATDVPVYVDLAEHYGSYGLSNYKLPLAFNKPMAKLNEVVVQPDEQQAPAVGISKELSIDVDSHIPRAKEQNPNAVALIVSISDYQASGIPKVKYAKNDAEVLRQYLIRTLGYKPENILPSDPDEQLTYGRIQTYIKSILPSYLKPDGSSDLFVYYTGHGAPNASNHDGYLVPWDCDPNYVNNDNAYDMKQFYVDIEKLNARHKIIVVDACFSGRAGNGETLLRSASPIYLRVNNPLVADSNTVVFQSSGADQVSNWYDEKRHGMFTYFFLKGIQGAADFNGDGIITADELIKYINDQNGGLPYWSNRLYQRPQEAQLEGEGQTVIERIQK